ncbi:MAG: DUF2236 domain-containing protein [Acidimicrobiales bacterium]|nr:DUF2236 domain-containing protein [Acidimicrobiales bacterium]
MAPLTAPLDALWRTVSADVRGLLAAQPMPPEWFHRTPEDPGLFDPDSVIWRVHANRSGLIGGLRALLLQTMHPLAMAGVHQHSDYRHDPWGRLRRTGAYIAVTTYGSTSAAEAIIERVRRIHDTVEGTATDGRTYRANDPHLLAWVHATEVDSFLRAYQRYGGGDLTPADEDRYVAEMAEVAERLGVIDAPRRRDQLRAQLHGYRPELQATGEARQAVRFLLWPPLPAYLRPAYGLLAAAAVGLLPGFVRRELWLPTAPLADPLLVRPAVRVVLQSLGSALGTEPPALQLVNRWRAERPAPEVTAGGSPTPSARRSPPAAPVRTGPAASPATPSGRTKPAAGSAGTATTATTRRSTPARPPAARAGRATPKAPAPKAPAPGATSGRVRPASADRSSRPRG